MLTYLEISLFDSPAQTLVNTVNTVGVMGKGIAARFRQFYPEMYEEYRSLCLAGEFNIGMLYIYRTPNKIIVNFPTKKHWRERSKLESVRKGLKKFVENYTRFGISSISFPQLGCGNGELDWDGQVQPIMERYLKNVPIPVYIHLYKKPRDFTPERLDVEYARQMRLERQRISADQLWKDLRAIAIRGVEKTGVPDLFDLGVSMDEEHVIFKSDTGESLIVYRDDMEDIWNMLRVRGTLRVSDLPNSIQKQGTAGPLLNFLKQLEYIYPIALRTKNHGASVQGLRYVPPAEDETINETEINMI